MKRPSAAAIGLALCWATTIGFVVGMTCLAGCAHEPDKGTWQFCRAECSDLQPTWTWYGGPTLQSEAHAGCMERCRTGRGGPPPAEVDPRPVEADR